MPLDISGFTLSSGEEMTNTVVVDSQNEGPRVGISAGVHGNEKSGVKAAKDFLARLESGEMHLIRGKIDLILEGNEEALKENERGRQPGNKYDLNRLIYPDGIPPEDREESYEQRRGREIQEVIDAGAESWCDLHSVSAPTGLPYAFASKKGFETIGKDLGISNMAINMANANKEATGGEPRWLGVADYVNMKGNSGFTFEAGYHDDPACYVRTYQALINFLVAHDMIEAMEVVGEEGNISFEKADGVVPIGPAESSHVHIEYRHNFKGEVDKDTGEKRGGFEYKDNHPASFTFFEEGQVIGYDISPDGEKTEVRAKFDGHIILPKDPSVCTPGNEVFYYGKNMKEAV